MATTDHGSTTGRQAAKPPAGFGAFAGVFTPCTLTILGVIMFLRLGQVVGTAGVGHALLIVLAAMGITALTALSLSSIATNTRVRAGGAYYLISRSLGVESGGAIGLVFFLSQAISVSLYVMGFTESLLAGLGWDPTLAPHPTVLVASAVNLGVLVCVYVGAGWTIRLQFGILAVLVAAIGSFAVGAAGAFDPELLAANWEPAYVGTGSGPLPMFAIFFPAATGIMAGANMSGDLADPGRAIPRGTLLAIAFTALVYLALVLLLGGSLPRGGPGEAGTLVGDSMALAGASIWLPLVVAGIFAATLSSALTSQMGAPRILQALARDRVFPILGPFARGSGPRSEPRRAILLTFAIAQLGILGGSLDAIAPVITMFFLITYGVLNLATFVEAFTANPSYRPTFRACPRWVSLAGALACCTAMFLIDWRWAGGAVLVMGVIYRYLKRKEIRASWGDVTSGAAIERARRNLLVLQEERYHPKNWRPAILAMGAASEDRLHLARYGRWLGGAGGILFIAQVLTGKREDLWERSERLIAAFITEHDLQAFPAVVQADCFPTGLRALLQCAGIGGLRPNLVLLGWSADPERRAEFLAALRVAHGLKRSIAVLRSTDVLQDPDAVPPGPIDVWWLGLENGSLMLLLAHLLRSGPTWRDRPIRLLRMLPPAADLSDAEQHLRALAERARIRVETRLVSGTDFGNALMAHSRGSALVILGFRPGPDGDESWLDRLDDFSSRLPRTLLVNSAGDMLLEA